MPRCRPYSAHLEGLWRGQAEGLWAGRPGLQAQGTDTAWVRSSTTLPGAGPQIRVFPGIWTAQEE